MGVDLVGVGKEANASYPWSAWWYLFDLACEHGWEPAGTKSPTFNEGGAFFDPNWEGGYGSNDHQEVTKEDAENLANALETALAGDLECDHASAPSTAEALTRAVGAAVDPDFDLVVSSEDPEGLVATKIAGVLRNRAGEPVAREVIQGFIGFCRQSQGFEIW